MTFAPVSNPAETSGAARAGLATPKKANANTRHSPRRVELNLMAFITVSFLTQGFKRPGAIDPIASQLNHFATRARYRHAKG
jgi:hypothetical protein